MSTFEVASVASALVLFVLTLPGTMELLALTVAAVLPLRKSQPGQPRRVRSVVVVLPAHNEEGGIRACIQSLQACERPDARTEIFVVADNCTDRTAEVARSAGARVLIRENASRRGKGYALRSAFEALAPEGHDAFLVVDVRFPCFPQFPRRFSQGVRVGCGSPPVPVSDGKSERLAPHSFAASRVDVLQRVAAPGEGASWLFIWDSWKRIRSFGAGAVELPLRCGLGSRRPRIPH